MLGRINQGSGHRIGCQLAGNLASFMATKAIGYQQQSATHANVVVEQLWPQLVILDTNDFTSQIGHHKVVLVVFALQPPIGEAKDNDLMCGAVGTHTFCSHCPSYFDRP